VVVAAETLLASVQVQQEGLTHAAFPTQQEQSTPVPVVAAMVAAVGLVGSVALLAHQRPVEVSARVAAAPAARVAVEVALLGPVARPGHLATVVVLLRSVTILVVVAAGIASLVSVDLVEAERASAGQLVVPVRVPEQPQRQTVVVVAAERAVTPGRGQVAQVGPGMSLSSGGSRNVELRIG
jgi:hypothetical protein